jgi:hypothetical protein
MHKTLLAALSVTLISGAGARLSASPILLPGGLITVPGLSTTGVSFTFSGTLTQNDTLALTQTGDPCLQSPAAYCTNGAGVVTKAGTSPVGATTSFTGTFGGTTASWNFGSLLIEISGAGSAQVFDPNAATGLGSATPPLGLALAPTSLAALGFSAFSQVNPTITFVMADTLYSDNSGQFSLTQVPEPATGGLAGILACALVGLVRRKH